MKKFLLVLIVSPLLLFTAKAQVASISYATPQVYSAGAAITPLTPTNSGGAVPNALYTQVSTFVSNASLINAGGLATDPSGNIYVSDATNNVIRKITTAGVISIFAGGAAATPGTIKNGTGTAANFNGPIGLATDAAGNIYVADAGNNAIRKITPAGVVTTLAGNYTGGVANGNGVVAGFFNPTGVATDASGNVYVADSGNNLIRKITPAGDVTYYAGNINGMAMTAPGSSDGVGTAASFRNPYAIASDASGNLYVADQGNYTIRKITPSGSVGSVTTLAGTAGNAGSTDGTGPAASFSSSIYGVATDSYGNVYVADAGNYVIRQVTQGGVVTTLAGNGYSGSQNGIGTNTSFGFIYGITTNAQNEVYFSDAQNSIIRKLEPYGYIISPALPAGLSMAGTGTISGTPTTPSPSTDYTVTAYNGAGASAPVTVNITVLDATLSALTVSTGTLNPSFSPGSDVYVVNVPNSTTSISVTPTAGNVISTIKVNGVITVSGTASTPLTLATGSNTISILVNAQDGSSTTYQVYVVRAATPITPPSITYTTPHTYLVGTAITNLTPTNSGGAIPASPYAQVTTFSSSGFNGPTGVAIDAQENVYVTDQNNNVIKKITPGGAVSIFAGGGATQGADGTGAAANFASPFGIAIDPQGNLYVADYGDNKIRMITPAGVVTTYAGSPINNPGYADGPAASSLFNGPTGVAVDLYNNIYVADSGNGAIRKITPEGVVSTLATGLNGPFGVATDQADNVYVAVYNGNQILKITQAGVVSVLAGSGTSGYINGTGTGAQFSNPYGLVVDVSGDIYVADANNGQIRKITQAGVVTTAAGDGNFNKNDGVGTAASFSYVTGVSIDPQGFLYVADFGNNEIRKMVITGYAVNPKLPTGLNLNPTTGIISGTPTTATPLQNYTVTAYNNGGSSSFNVGIQVITPATDATLSNLTLSSGTLSPVFASATTSYTATVSAATSSITITPTTDNAAATVKVNNTAATSGSAFGPIALNTGANTITVVVKAQNGTTTMTYTIVVTRGASTDDNLTNLVLSQGTLAPVFATGTTGYTASVGNAVTGITVTPTTENAGATVKVNGAAVTSGSATGTIALVVGPNTINTVVTAQDGVTTQTYTVTVTRSAVVLSSNKNLSNLTVSSGTISPAFASATTGYTLSVGNSTSTITVTPTTADPTATVTVNGSTVTSSSASGAIPLTAGTTTPVAVVVTAQDGTQQTYTITVSRAASSNANLSNLTISSGTLNPAFATATTSYTAAVSNATASVTVTPTAADPTANITVNGAAVTSGSASGAIALTAGTTTSINIAVIAQDGTQVNYTINVTRPLSSNNTLSNLTISSGTLNPVFAAATINYTASVSSSTASITVTPTAADPTANITVNGATVTNGSASGAIALSAGSTTTIPVLVTAQDGTQLNYSIAVTRAASANNDLSNLTLSSGTLNPAFAGATTNYTASVSNATASITVTPTAADATAGITVNSTPVASGSASGAIALATGPNTINITVTAQNGVSQTYTVNVTRAGSSTASLSYLSISSGTLSPVFTAATTTYSATVGNTTNSITFTPTAADPTSTILVNGTTVASGTASGPITLNVGANPVNITVTAQDGTTQVIYTVTVTRSAPPSTNSALAGLTISSGSLSPAFAAGNTTYTAAVTGSTTAITVTPSTADATATVTVNGTAVTSGSPSTSIPLTIGANQITTIVTAQNGTTTTYTITVNRPSPDADLLNLTLSAGALSPAFSAATNSYTASVSNTTGSITVTPTVDDANASVTVNGTAVTSGTASTPIALSEGSNNITITVTAQDGTIKTYSITVNRAAAVLSNNAALSNLTLSTGDALTPVFSSTTNTYTATVSNATSSIMLTPTTADANATVSVNGNVVTSGSPSGAIALAVGSSNVVTIKVTAQDGVTSQTYTVTITRLSADDNLSALSLSSGTLSPVFAPGATSYTANVINSTIGITVTPTAEDANATITVNGTAVGSGSASGNIPLTVGANTITTVVTAQDGSTKNYVVTVTRAAAALSTNAFLSNLTVNTGTLNPVFAAGTFNYTESVSNSTSSLAFTPTTSDPNATVTVNGTTVTSGSASNNIALNVGPNTITVTVTAQDGATIKTYTVAVTRLSSDADLANLTLSSGTLAPVFAAATTGYIASVSNATSGITVTPTLADATASVTVNGTAVSSGAASGNIALTVGSNIITVLVTAQDNTTKTYTVTVTRAAPAQSTNASLANLTISNGTLTPVFAAVTSNYTATVSNITTVITVTPTTADATATVTVNGKVVASGSNSAGINLQVGTNTITTVVTAQDGATTKTYTIVVTRLSSDADLSNITLSSGTLSPVFAQGTTSYSASVSNITTEVTLTPTTDDTNATVTVNGSAVTSGSASPNIALSVGANTITTIVKAQDGTTKTYTVSITRAAAALATNANLSNLGISAGTLAPVFNSNSLNYTATVANSVTSIAVTPTTADANATVTVNGIAVTSGSASGAIALKIGVNTITTTVTAQDGATKQNYIITVTRTASANAGLANIVLSSGTLTPAFAANTTNYTASVAYAVSSITLTPTPSDATASITVNGNAVTNSTASAPIALSVGPNTITTVVTAQDGVTQQTYTVTVTRGPSPDADLADLTVNYGTLSPVFASGTTVYNDAVPNNVNTITLVPTTADPKATVTVNGTAIPNGSSTVPILLNVGSTTITTVVTAQDGVTTKTYTVTVTRSGLASDATLSNLTISTGALSPVFTPTYANYSVQVPYSTKTIQVTPTANNPNATITVNGTAVASGAACAPIALNVGSVLVTISVKAQDGVTIENYTVIVTRATPSFNANMAALTISSGTLTPAFKASTFVYGAEVLTTVSSITVTPTAADNTATITVNGSPVPSGTASGPLALSVGNNVITVVITAENGVNSNSYALNVIRDSPYRSSNDSLSHVSLSSGTLEPVFDPGTLTYSASVSNETPAITITPVTADPTATVTVNGAVVVSGKPSVPVNLAVGNNIITITVTAQNGSSVKTYTIVVNRGPYEISVPNTFTPNGDGINDTWAIKNIEIFPGSTVRVFNRGGQLVFSSIGYGTQWDGTLNGAALPSGTYYYIIDIKTKGRMSGALVIIR